jgi:hypothetical protein
MLSIVPTLIQRFAYAFPSFIPFYNKWQNVKYRTYINSQIRLCISFLHSLLCHQAHVGFVVDKIVLGQLLARVLRFPLPIFIPLSALFLSSVIRTGIIGNLRSKNQGIQSHSAISTNWALRKVTNKVRKRSYGVTILAHWLHSVSLSRKP